MEHEVQLALTTEFNCILLPQLVLVLLADVAQVSQQDQPDNYLHVKDYVFGLLC